MMTGQKEVEKCLVTWQVEGKGLQHQQRKGQGSWR